MWVTKESNSTNKTSHAIPYAHISMAPGHSHSSSVVGRAPDVDLEALSSF